MPEPSLNLLSPLFSLHQTRIDDAIMYNVEISGVLGSFHTQGEYTGSSVRRVGEETLSFGGWYVQAGYFLTGENRAYDRKTGKYKRVVPHSIVGEGGFGAWEVAARYSEMDLISGNIGDRAFKLGSGITSEYGRYVKYPGGAP